MTEPHSPAPDPATGPALAPTPDGQLAPADGPPPAAGDAGDIAAEFTAAADEDTQDVTAVAIADAMPADADPDGPAPADDTTSTDD